MNFHEQLNEEQYAAVSAPDGPSLVIAAAGTGKTRTLVYRVAWLIEQGVDPNRILLLTFTNKAAREMLDRAHALTGGAVSGLLGGTFHHLANRLLRQHAREIGFGHDYTILDADDSRKLMKSCAGELELDDEHFPKPQVLLSLYGLASGSQKPLDDLAYDWFDDAPFDIGDVLKLRDHYVARKKALNVMDFDDLLLYALKLFQTSEYVRSLYQERFQYVLVDEYQDTNTIQAEWVHLLAGKHKNLMVVGDDFQSIYSWRGADYQNFLSFPRRCPDTKIYKLETNYRSTPEILDVANACIKGNPFQFQKTLHAVRGRIADPTLALLRDGDEQAHYVISKIEELRRKGTKLSDIAVLYRSHFHAMELQMALTHARFPFQITSGIRFFEQAHIKDTCTVLRLLENPQDELAFKRLLELFPKIGPKTADKIWKKFGSRFEARKPEAHTALLAALPAAAALVWREIQRVFLAYEKENLSEDPGEIIYRFNEAFYSEYLVETFDNARHRQEDLDSLIDFTSRFETCAAFLSEMALLTNLDAEAETSPAAQEGIRLSTIHQAKGLEWKTVFVLWLNEGLFPSFKSVEQVGGESEERRLFYVAVTRAEDRLFLCSPKMRWKHDGGAIPCSPSIFIREIPEHLLKRESGFSYG
ncbi:MAG: ATP-dependent helicase [Pontiellaceae bacterium]|jgi:DNA helicase-2/ATP-dependent DNA helicase PcrA|nr:ATP-dependent helicase [Pontiellaceae bacterium]